ncbi:MAG: hypothetical protein P1V97_15145 [Planctomycetota bacterium]|nr:hypothetical protein [Planctomycetota bacterium]
MDTAELWVGTDLGLYHLRRPELVKQYTDKDGLGGKKVAGLHLCEDGTLVVGGSGNFTLMKNGEILEVVKKGLIDKTASDIASFSNGEIWFRGYKGTTRRAPDGTLTKYFKTNMLAGQCPHGDRMIVSEYDEWDMRHWCFKAGIDDPVEMPQLGPFAGFIGSAQAGGYDWLLSTAGELLALKSGEPIGQFVLGNSEISEFGQLSYANEIFWLSGRGYSYGVQLSDCIAALRKEPDNAAFLESPLPLFQFP